MSLMILNPLFSVYGCVAKWVFTSVEFARLQRLLRVFSVFTVALMVLGR